MGFILMRMIFDLEEYSSEEMLENDFLDTIELLGSLRGKRFENDGRVVSAKRVIGALYEDFQRNNWPLVFATLPKIPNKHDRDCDCGKCFPTLFGKRKQFIGKIYDLNSLPAVRNYDQLYQELFRLQPLEAFAGESYEAVVSLLRSRCQQRRWYLYDPITRCKEEF